MKVRSAHIIAAVILFCGYPLFSQTQSQSVSKSAKEYLDPEQIILKFTHKETEFYEAWMQYEYTQKVLIRVLAVNDVPQKESMTIVTEVVFKDDGTRAVRTVKRTRPLRSVTINEDDQEIFNNINPFALTTKELSLYNLEYRGKEKIDELNCYVFSVKPKKLESGKRYFDGKIWVDDRDLQIVRTVGKAVPQSKEPQFPEFETIRQMIDNKYWFPVWTHAKSVLEFPGKSVLIEETITYENYKKFRSEAIILKGTVKPLE
jgi:hypothetical protein